ncbi:MAG: radical SAM protein [Anaerolineae bacterium]
MRDLLLVNPLFVREDPVERRLMTPYFPLGLLYLAAVAREAGYDVAIFDAMFGQRDEDFVAALEREELRVVGVSVLATVRDAALRLAELAHRHGATVVVGGADPTARPDLYLQYQTDGIHPVDLVVVGEGEATLLELLPLLLLSEDRLMEHDLDLVKGLAYLSEEGRVVVTPSRPLINDLDSLPLPARDLIDIERYRKVWRSHHGFFSLSLIATRGCPYSCTWCQKSVFGRSFRPRSPETVAEEMRVIKERYHPDQIRIVDDVMGIDDKWVRAWHNAVLTRDAVIPFECLSRVDLMDGELVLMLKEAGCRRIHFGAESGSQKVLDAINKGTMVPQMYRAAEICRRLGIETYFYMMVGYPGEGWEDLKLSMKLLRETRPDVFSTTIAYPLPGTKFYEQVRDRLMVEGKRVPDWAYTAENRLLFRRGRYNTFFYRWVIRWFHVEWKEAWFRAGRRASLLARLKTRAGLWLTRLVVNLLARMPGATAVRFHPTSSLSSPPMGGKEGGKEEQRGCRMG